MLTDTLLFIFCMVITGILLLLFIYFIVILTDLECDYINPQECSSRLNIWNIPALVGQAVITFALLVHGCFFLFLANLPLAIWPAYRAFKGKVPFCDPSMLQYPDGLKYQMKDVLLKTAFYFTIFFVYLYQMIVAMLNTHPMPGHKPSTEFDEF